LKYVSATRAGFYNTYTLVKIYIICTVEEKYVRLRTRETCPATQFNTRDSRGSEKKTLE
jgi:hypothetical protein